MAKLKAGTEKKTETEDKVTGAVPYRPKMSAAAARSAVNEEIGRRIKLAEYRSAVAPLPAKDRDLIIGQAIAMLDQIYAHLPLKRSKHAGDPIQALKLLRLHQAELDEREFQSALIEIFLGLRDLHTNYILPKVYASKYAFLPSGSRNSTSRVERRLQMHPSRESMWCLKLLP